MNVTEFVAKWRKSELSERSAAQQHFLDLCEVLDHPKPADIDSSGDSFTFERGAAKTVGGDGWADVWKRGFFGWEYKSKRKDLDAAYQQLLQYREALENPPLLIVCDMERFIVHTNFTNTPACVHEVWLVDLASPRSLEILRAAFFAPEKLRPGITSQAITEEAAWHLAEIAQRLRDRGVDSTEVARFLDRIVFCLFAEDIGLLPENVFSRTVARTSRDPQRLQKLLDQLFLAMADGGDFGLEEIRRFNGHLFDNTRALLLTVDEIHSVHRAAQLDWSAVEPAIFGTLFERGLDPAKRSQIGAHYTSRQDIEALLEPIVMRPLRRDWDETRRMAENLLRYGLKNPGMHKKGDTTSTRAKPLSASIAAKARKEADKIVQKFLQRLDRIKVLDPACGSGNFLYVTLQKLKDLEKDAITWATDHGLGSSLPLVGPWQLFGIEINHYAHELAQMAVWIGYLQWSRANGFGYPQDPVLRPMAANFQCMDAIIDFSDPERPCEPEWPRVDFIVGNPPFLGDKLMRRELGDTYVEQLRSLYGDRIPGQSDLCCYWFERARAQIAAGKCTRVGLLATQAIRGGASREVLKRIKSAGGIFWAESDRPWILDGASVHVSMVGFDDGAEKARILDGETVPTINANLSAAIDTTQARRIPANISLGFIGSCKGGPFDIDEGEAIRLLRSGGNPHGRPNSDVVRPVANSKDLMMRRPQRWIIDNANLELEDASLYEAVHAIVQVRVKPKRDQNRNRWLRVNWWRPQRMRPPMREAIRNLPRFLVTPTTSKHRIFRWLTLPVLPDHKLDRIGICISRIV